MFQVLLLRTVVLMNVPTMVLVMMAPVTVTRVLDTMIVPLRCVPMVVHLMGNVSMAPVFATRDLLATIAARKLAPKIALAMVFVAKETALAPRATKV